MQTKRVELEYIKEFDSYGIPKNVLLELYTEKVLADIRLPDKILKEKENTPFLGSLLGQDMSKDGTDYYTISPSYMVALKSTGPNICFLDYDNPVAQTQKCHGTVLPGGVFDCPKDYFIKNENLGKEIDKRFFAYKNIIKKEVCSSLKHKPTEKGEICLHKLKFFEKHQFCKLWVFLQKMKFK